MYNGKDDTIQQQLESLKNDIPGEIKITTSKASDCERQLDCPPFSVYLCCEDNKLDLCYDMLKDHCKDKKWKLTRVGHRDFLIDPDPVWTKLGRKSQPSY